MLRSYKHFCIASVLLLGIIAAPAAHAQLNFTLTPAGQSGLPGDTLHFTGTLSNPTADTYYLTGDSVTFNAPGVTVDDSPFFNNAPSSLGPSGGGSDTYTGGFFDVNLSHQAVPGTYNGTFIIQGGTGTNDQNTIASQPFTVTVQQSSAPVPEASSVISLGLLLTLGLGGMVIVRRKRHAESQA